MSHTTYLVLAYYNFVRLPDPHEEVLRHKEFCSSRDITARLYISEEGINGQMSASEEAGKEYMEWMGQHPQFKNTIFKLHRHYEHAFPRLTIKYRKQLVALDRQVDMAKTGERLSPKEWKERLETEEDRILIDVRNEYEWRVGRFAGADLPKCETFREFCEYADHLKGKIQPETSVMMYCTGGIRCEVYSAYLKELGIEKVYQLDGGIINYGLQEGSKYWEGKLFVFDDRLTVPISEEEAPVVGQCHHCGQASDHYYNCANMDCNCLFLCCSACLEKFQGCCQSSCQTSPRLRPYQQQNPNKPFRRKNNYSKT